VRAERDALLRFNCGLVDHAINAAPHADGWMLYPAVLFGLAIPSLIYLFIRIGASLYIDCHAKS
jgi:hypothetical protein